MCKLVWVERPMGMTIVKTKIFPDAAERFKFILQLERTKYFDRVLEMS